MELCPRESIYTTVNDVLSFSARGRFRVLGFRVLGFRV